MNEQVRRLVELEAMDNAEAGAQGRGDESGAVVAPMRVKWLRWKG